MEIWPSALCLDGPETRDVPGTINDRLLGSGMERTVAHGPWTKK